MKELISKLNLPDYVAEIANEGQSVTIPKSREELAELSLGGSQSGVFNVRYKIDGVGSVTEASVTKCKNGTVINYPDDYMRRRDPDCLLIADDKETDKPRYKDRYNEDFEPLRTTTFDWLKAQDLVVLPFKAGGLEYGYDAVLIAPLNAACFAFGLADLQGFINIDEIDENFNPKTVIYLAPPFRHTHFNGKQIVIHNRLDDLHELFSYNLYPGPSAKKGVYGVLLNIGEQEGWITVHGSTVKVITPYDNEVVIMHESASGGGKSEMLENMHKELDGRIVLGRNTVTNEKVYISLRENCELHPITDDMALCHPDIQNGSNKLVVTDAEDGWFLRLDHIKEYGTTPHHEKLFIQPKEPLLFFNMEAVPGSTCLVWEHIMDSNGKPCPNPRAILPRKFLPNIINEPVEVDVRSFGVRVPPCTKENPSYGIMGLFHVLPPALAWLWRLAAPRGHNNPSIVSTEGMSSEGVGSYWPFATGKMVEQANLLLRQMVDSFDTKYILIPNQHVGAYHVGFMSQWVAREYIARKGNANFKPELLKEARCPLLGYALESLRVDGQYISRSFLQVERQHKVGPEGYDAGAEILMDFFKQEIEQFDTPLLDPLGKQIIDLFFNNGTVEQYTELMPM